MTEMSSRQAHRLPITEATHIVPNHFLVPKRRPAVGTTFHQKVLKGSATRRLEERLSRVGIVKGNFSGLLSIIDKLGSFKVAAVFRVVAIEVADAIRRLLVTPPPEIILNRAVMVNSEDDGIVREKAYKMDGLIKMAIPYVSEVPCAFFDMILSSPITHGGGNFFPPNMTVSVERE